MIKSYKKYCDRLAAAGLLDQTLHRQIHHYECEWICSLFGQLGTPATILEIGRSKGHSFGLFRYLAPDAYVVSVDPVRHPEADRIAAHFNHNDKFEFIDGTINDVDKEKWAGKFDFVLIDGNHHFRGVKHDWDMVSRFFISKSSVVVFDNLAIKAVAKVFNGIGEEYVKERPCDVPGFIGTGTFGVVHRCQDAE